MRTVSVVVLPYDRAWKSAFQEIKQEIDGVIGDLIVGIEHVGSTLWKDSLRNLVLILM